MRYDRGSQNQDLNQGGNIQSFLATPTRIYTTVYVYVYVYRYTAYTIYRQHGAKLLCDCARRAAAAVTNGQYRSTAWHICIYTVRSSRWWLQTRVLTLRTEVDEFAQLTVLHLLVSGFLLRIK